MAHRCRERAPSTTSAALHVIDRLAVEVDDEANASRHVSFAPSLQEPPQFLVDAHRSLQLVGLRLHVALAVDGVARKVNPSVLRIAHSHQLANRAGTSASVDADE